MSLSIQLGKIFLTRNKVKKITTSKTRNVMRTTKSFWTLNKLLRMITEIRSPSAVKTIYLDLWFPHLRVACAQTAIPTNMFNQLWTKIFSRVKDLQAKRTMSNLTTQAVKMRTWSFCRLTLSTQPTLLDRDFKIRDNNNFCPVLFLRDNKTY